MTRILTAAAMDGPRFTAEQIARLYDAIEIDDVVDPHTELPDRIVLDHDPGLLADCFRLSRQLLIDGIDRHEMFALLGKLRRDRDLDAAARVRFKDMRAKLKHFRFAIALYGERHRYPPVIDWLTTALGHAQDGFKTGQAGRVAVKAGVAQLLLAPGAWSLFVRERDRIVLTTPEGFRVFVSRDLATLDAVVRHGEVTGGDFHAARKVVSRQVSFYNAALTLRPDPEAMRMARSLAAINGLMGSLHDELIVRRVSGAQDYHRDRFTLPPSIHTRITHVLQCFRASGLHI